MDKEDKLGAKRSYLICKVVLSPISWPSFANVLDIYPYVDVDVLMPILCVFGGDGHLAHA